MKARASVLLVGLCLTASAALGQDLSSAPASRKDYSAQRKPRVAVMKFDNTNTEAQQRKYGESVSAMLLTFLKRKSQLVVVERQNLDKVLDEWKLQQSGATTESSSAGQQLLQSIDAILDGRVTVLAACQGGGGNGASTPNCSSASDEVEIDARLISKEDAHIISVGHQRGKASTMRQTVEMLGTELENGFLRPYVGSLTVTIPEPSNVRVYLTPILSADASDDERPPVELDRTASTQSRAIVYDKWLTVPTVASVSNLLGGWYTIRLDRPGYEGIGTDSLKVVMPPGGRDGGGPVDISGRALSAEQQSYLVHVTPFETTRWPADSRRIVLKKKGGGMNIQVRREFLDRDFVPATTISSLRTVVRAETSTAGPEGTALLEINSTDDVTNVGDTDLSATTLMGQSKLDVMTGCDMHPVFDQFQGGRLVVEDYHRLADAGARRLPVGSYRVFAAQRNYVVTRTAVVELANSPDERVVQVDMRRLRINIELENLGPATPNRSVTLEGRETHYQQTIPLDFTGKHTVTNLPIDTYTLTTDRQGFEMFHSSIHLDDVDVMPTIDQQGCGVTAPTYRQASIPSFTLKSQPWLAGRLSRMKQFPDDRTTVLAHQGYEALLNQITMSRGRQAPTTAAGQTSSLIVGRTAGAEEVRQDAIQNFRDYLWEIDLLYLDDQDMQQLLALPEAAAVIRDYIAAGGAVFCFASTPGDYSTILGAQVPIDPKKKTLRNKVELGAGELAQVQLNVKLEFKPAREFPTTVISPKAAPTGWRVLSYRKGRKEPAIIERGDMKTGGYVVVWLDSLGALPQREDLLRQVMSSVENRAFTWAQYLMYRRYGPSSSQMRDAAARLESFSSKVSGSAKVALMPNPF